MNKQEIPEGGYKIDIAVQDENSNNLLALEFDGKAYLESKKARDRDYHKRKYLEARGWKVYRLWSHLWYQNKQKLIFEIKNKTIEKILVEEATLEDMFLHYYKKED